jgi:hypothetical protein
MHQTGVVVVADERLTADTDLVIDFLRGKRARRRPHRNSLRSGVVRFSAATAFELRLGADFLRRRRQVEGCSPGARCRST